eukprot:GILK01004271.1.p1 GENE.GILK01004271.1~~GILK01004271.1.p1  ORF type:complete len:468 (+),score=87.07 GILK01004271.1:97-1500(+)
MPSIKRKSSDTPIDAIFKKQKNGGRNAKKSNQNGVEAVEEPRALNALQMASDLLHQSSVPAQITGREQEKETISTFIQTSLRNRAAGSMYICGSPGTGKTASLEEIHKFLLGWIKQEKIQPAPKVIKLNGMTFTEPNKVYNKLFEDLGLSKKKKTGTVKDTQTAIVKELCRAKDKQTPMNVVVIDEMDQLMTKDQSVLYQLFEWPSLPNSSLILIGIANSVDMTSSILPYLRTKRCEPILTIYKPYEKEDIARIIQERLSQIKSEQPIIEPLAIEMVARKVSKFSGDVRKALDICRRAIDTVSAEMRNQPTVESMLLDDESMSMHASATAPSAPVGTVTLKHVNNIMASAFGSPHVSTIKSLPLHQQICLCVAVVQFKQSKQLSTAAELYTSYCCLCRRQNLPCVSMADFQDMLQTLSHYSLLSIKQSKDARLRKISLAVNDTDVDFAIGDNRIFRQFLDENLPQSS